MSGFLAPLGTRRPPFVLGLLAAITFTFSLPSDLVRAETSASRKLAPQSVRLEDNKSPFLLIASIRKQRVRLYDRSGEVSNARISSGRPGFDTPTGVFAIIQKNKHHVSNIYGAKMPFMQRLTWSGIALHAGPLPGYRASHGCIRLPYRYAQQLFSSTSMGTRVIVTHEETRPIDFDHPNLIKPLPAELPEQTRVASNSRELTQIAAADTGRDTFDTHSTLQNLVNLPQYFWFTPALAEAVANLPPEQRPPQTRAEADAFVRAQIDRLQQDVDATKAARDKAEKARAEAKSKIRDNSRDLKRLEKEFRKLSRDADRIEKRLTDAQSRFDKFMAQQAIELTNATTAYTEIEQREADLEDEILAIAHDRDTTQAALNTAAKEMDRVTDELVKAEDIAASESRQASQAARDIKFAMTALAAAKNEVARRKKPVSVFVSLRDRRVYVRQGFQAVIDAPIEIIGTPRRFGTHVFTAMGYDAADANNSFKWSLVTAQAPALRSASGSKKRKAKQQRLSEEMQREFASAALESFILPEDVTTLVRELARTGASMIISDQKLPRHENGKGTDFVILTK